MELSEGKGEREWEHILTRLDEGLPWWPKRRGGRDGQAGSVHRPGLVTRQFPVPWLWTRGGGGNEDAYTEAMLVRMEDMTGDRRGSSAT